MCLFSARLMPWLSLSMRLRELLLAGEDPDCASLHRDLLLWPVHLAAKEKFFANEGLDAEVIVMRTNVGIAALVTGSIDFTTAGGSAMRAAVNGAPLKMVLNITKKADLWVLSQEEYSAGRRSAR